MVVVVVGVLVVLNVDVAMEVEIAVGVPSPEFQYYCLYVPLVSEHIFSWLNRSK